jgi:hypothetical protein
MFNERDVVSFYYLQMSAFHRRVDENLGIGLNIFIGDSLIQGLAVNSVINNVSDHYGVRSPNLSQI